MESFRCLDIGVSWIMNIEAVIGVIVILQVFIVAYLYFSSKEY